MRGPHVAGEGALRGRREARYSGPMVQRSAGILPFRDVGGRLEVFLVHPGGPFFRKKDLGAWSVAKGLIEGDEEPLAAARREWVEETGFAPPEGPYVALGQVRQKSGKRVHAWAVRAADLDPEALDSDTFELEWPPRSGKTRAFPEVDRAAWFDVETARRKILEAQVPLIERLIDHLAESPVPGD